MAGRPPLPKNIKVLQGTFRPGREVANPEPPLFEAAPKPPKSIRGKVHKRARAEWVRISPELVSLGLLSVIDVTALECYCLAYERMIVAEEALSTQETVSLAMNLRAGSGMIMTSPNGFEMQRPEVSIAAQARKEVKDFLVQFGMTPASRSRVAAKKKAPATADPMERLLNEA